MRKSLAWACVGTALVLAVPNSQATELYKNPRVATEQRVEDLLSRMTLEEKIDLLGGTGFGTKSNPRLGIPELKMTDGPVGVRWGQATSFPSGISMAASFNRELIRHVTGAMALETRAKGRDLLLAPCVGISRVPFGGRNFESFGEDPFLTSEMAAAYIRGLHDEGVMGSVKHYGLNDQEYERHTINSVIDERALHEIHLPAFKRAVDEGVGSVMASYNRFRGTYASENDYLLNEILKRRYGFEGFVVSDWEATHSVVPAALAGLDLEMPHGDHFGPPLLAAVLGGEVPAPLIDEKVRRLLRQMFRIGLFDGADKERPDVSVVNSLAHQQLALDLARESHVLLKNEGSVLPLDLEVVRKIAVIGPNAAEGRTGGGGSSFVEPFYKQSVLDGLRLRVGLRAEVNYALGARLPDFESLYPSASEIPLSRRRLGRGGDVQWLGEANNLMAPFSMGGFNAGAGLFEAGHLLEEAVQLAAQSDVAIVAVGFSSWLESEGIDRAIFSLPPGQDDLIEAVAAVNPRTIVVINTGNPVDMKRWVNKVSAVVYAWYPGQEGGTAFADIVLGTVNPSGRLPVTMMKSWEDSPAFGTYPEVDNTVDYKEGLYVGYRYYDTFGVEPLFPFGHGLSYTRFQYSDLALDVIDSRATSPKVKVSFTLSNVGEKPGFEVAQIYVRENAPTVERPEQELKGFEKVYLAPGESRRVTLELDASSFAHYEVALAGWTVTPGRFTVRVGASSRDIRRYGSFHLH